MALATLTIDIVAKLANLQTGFDKAAQLAEKNSKRMEQAFKNVGAVLKTALAGIGVQQLTQAFNAVVDGVAKFKDVSEQTGIAVEELSKLEPVARQAGLGIDNVAALSLKLSKALSGVDDESRGAGKALAQIGVDLEKFRRLGSAEQMQELARAMSKYADDGNKAAIGQAILGRQWQQAAPFLKDLAEAGELNATVTKEQAAQADEYNKAIERLKLQIVDLARGPILTAITAVSNELGRLSDATQAFGGKMAGFLFNMELAQFDDAAVAVNLLNDQIVALQRTLEANPSAATREERIELDRLIKSRDFYLLQMRRQQEMQKILSRPSAGSFTGQAGTSGSTAKQSDADRFLQSLQRSALAANYTAEELLRIEAAQKGVTAAAEPWIQSIEAAKEGVQSMQELNAFALAETGRFLAEQSAIVDGIMDGIEASEELRIAGDDLNDTLVQMDGIADKLGFTFSSAFEDAIIGGKELGEVLDGLWQDVQRIIIRQMITAPLANAIGQGLSDMFPQRAAGGPVSAGGAYVVGEQGPELLVMGSKSGTIVPNKAIGGGDTILNVMNYGPPMRAEQTTRQTPTGTIVDLILREVEGDVRRGGRVSAAMQQQFGLNRAAGLAR